LTTSGLRRSFNGVFLAPQGCGCQKTAFFERRKTADGNRRRVSNAPRRFRVADDEEGKEAVGCQLSVVSPTVEVGEGVVP